MRITSKTPRQYTRHITRQFLFVLPLLALCVGTSGCIWNRAKINDPTIVEYVSRIKVGRTPIVQVPHLLGAVPSSITPLSTGDTVHAFSYGDTRTNGLNLILFVFTKTNVSTSAIYVTADDKGVVKQVVTTPFHAPEWESNPFGE